MSPVNRDLDRRTVLSALVLGAAALAGCSARRPTGNQPTAATRVPAAPSATVASPIPGRLQVHQAPSGPVLATLDSRLPSGAPLTLLVKQEAQQWAEVLVPIRPNGSAGWVRLSEVTLENLAYRIEIGLVARSMTVWDGSTALVRTGVAIGAPTTPTPTGSFFITELLGPLNPADGYGTFAYGTSAFSDVLDNFGSGPGVIGIHGTTDADSIGQPVSHGCVRLPEVPLQKLVPILPLGTPVEIKP